jgi:hypothetical protein
MKRLLSIALALLLITPLSAAQRKHRSTSPHRSQSSATATCKDGTTSYSAHRRGTCSHHGGVKTWHKDVPK